MKAVVQDTYGGPEVLRLAEVDRPALDDCAVLLRVHAAAVNPPDIVGMRGAPYIVRPAFGLRRPRSRVRGADLAGVVEAVGRDVRDFRVGDEVFGDVGTQSGAFSEYATARPVQLALKPAASWWSSSDLPPEVALPRLLVVLSTPALAGIG